MSFSVITPNFNMGCYLSETIQSVWRNLKPGDEYYIIDGGSRDKSVDIIRAHEKYLSGWVSEPDQGYADAQCWVNSGDLLFDEALNLAKQGLEKTGADFIFGDDFYIDENGHVISFSRG